MKILLYSVLICILSINCLAFSDNDVEWYKTNHPPYYIPDGSGVHDQIINYLIEKLPEYRHIIKNSNYKRALTELKNKKRGFLVGIFKTPERQKYLLYPEIPMYLSISPALILKKKDSKTITPFLNSKGRIDLDRYFSEQKRKIGISIGRSYSSQIDRLIKKHRTANKFITRTSQDIIVGQLQLLLNNRIDGYFAIPVSAAFSAKTLGIDMDSISIIQVEDVEYFTAVYFGLPQTKLGRELMKTVSIVTGKKDALKKFAEFYENWLNPSMKTSYRKIYTDYYLTRFGIDLR